MLAGLYAVAQMNTRETSKHTIKKQKRVLKSEAATTIPFINGGLFYYFG